MSNYDDDGQYYGSDEDYENDWTQAVLQETAALDDDSAALVYDELKNHRRKYSGNPRADAEISVRRSAQKLLGSHDSAAEDFIKYLTKTSGKSEGQIRKWARDTL